MEPIAVASYAALVYSLNIGSLHLKLKAEGVYFEVLKLRFDEKIFKIPQEPL